jgi:hypothetical protein
MTYTELVEKHGQEKVDAAAAEYMLRAMWKTGQAEKVLKNAKKKNTVLHIGMILAFSAVVSTLAVAIQTYLF